MILTKAGVGTTISVYRASKMEKCEEVQKTSGESGVQLDDQSRNLIL
jgi:hypothetical protein